jgi:phage/plasmid-like protein (TIGR03299 family)
VVCDNTREAALAEQEQAYKVKHSRHSHAQLAPAREALAMVHTLADEFAAEVSRLCATPVSEDQRGRFLDTYVSQHDTAGLPLKGRTLAMSERKRDILQRLYHHDERVAPWAGTAHGVIQAVNTYEHHERIVRGAPRPERNMLRTITGDFAKLDRNTLSALNRVLA